MWASDDYDTFEKSVKDGDCGEQSPNSCPPVDKRNSLTARPRLKFLEEKKRIPWKCYALLLVTFSTLLFKMLVLGDLACFIMPQ